jgi:hypothetical protein
MGSTNALMVAVPDEDEWAEAAFFGFGYEVNYLPVLIADAAATGWTAAAIGDLLAPIVALVSEARRRQFSVLPSAAYEAIDIKMNQAVYPGWPERRLDMEGPERDAWLRSFA